jgi:hypothetical protein
VVWRCAGGEGPCVGPCVDGEALSKTRVLASAGLGYLWALDSDVISVLGGRVTQRTSTVMVQGYTVETASGRIHLRLTVPVARSIMSPDSAGGHGETVWVNMNSFPGHD